MSRLLRPRGQLHFEKPPLELDLLVTRLEDRGLAIPDKERARRYLRHIGYYRLSPYTIPYQLGGPEHAFRVGKTFDDVLSLYVFDRALRLLVMDAIERIEVSMRAALSDHMATTYLDSHWYTDSSVFQDTKKQVNLLKIVQDTTRGHLARQPETDDGALVHRSALEHYLTTYGTPELLPSWLMVETLTFGQLRSVIENLKSRHDKKIIAANLGLPVPVMESWLRTYVRVRNVCAHHGRLWNVGLGVYPIIPKSRQISWLEAEDALPTRSIKRLYPVLVSIQSVLDTVSPHSSWGQRLQKLVNDQPVIYRAGMGIPENWGEDQFWKRRIKLVKGNQDNVERDLPG